MDRLPRKTHPSSIVLTNLLSCKLDSLDEKFQRFSTPGVLVLRQIYRFVKAWKEKNEFFS